MGRIEKIISNKELTLDYNSAKIIASPYDYTLTKRVIVRDMSECLNNFDIFKKSYETEEYLCETLGADVHYDYLNLNPNLKIPANLGYSCAQILDFTNSLRSESGYLGYFIEYNNLNIVEENLLNDLCFLTGNKSDVSIKYLKTKKYLKSLEVLQIKSVAQSSLIPNLMYLATEYANEPLEDIENIEFARVLLEKSKAPLIKNFEFETYDFSSDSPKTNEILSKIALNFIPVGPIPSTTCTYNTTLFKDIPNGLYKLGLAYCLIYGAELLYYFDSIKDPDLKNALDELFLVNYHDKSFCSKYLYTDSLGHLEINPDIKACFNSDNKTRFNNIKNLFENKIKDPEFNDDFSINLNYYCIPIFFAHFIFSMHRYAYQVARIKHATLLYKTAKDKGVLDLSELCDNIDEGYDEIFGTGISMPGEDSESSELIDLSTFSSSKDESSDEDFAKKEKEISKREKSTGPMLTAADMLKKDLYDSKYDFDIEYVKNSVSNKDAYNSISNNVKMITHELTKQIKEIRTYNTGGKQNGLLVGKLDKKNLWKYKTDPKIFYNNNYKIKEMDLAFGCILDESGSMSGEKIKNGRIVMIMLHEVLNSLGINHSIIGHTSHNMYHTKIYKYFQFKEESHYSLDKPYGLIKADNRSGNCDSGSLYYMRSVMKHVRNKDKIIIIFSDGQPTECTDTDLIKEVETIEKSGIHVIGVGINFDSIKEYYPDNANGKNLKEMVDIVVSILKRYVLEKKE